MRLWKRINKLFPKEPEKRDEPQIHIMNGGETNRDNTIMPHKRSAWMAIWSTI
jgi:hypothetical protein